jgi:hypothetical protein
VTKGKKKFYNIDTWRSRDICLDTVGVDSSGDRDLERYFFEVKLAENLTWIIPRPLCYWHICGYLTEVKGDLGLLPWSRCGEQSLARPGESPLPLAFLPW